MQSIDYRTINIKLCNNLFSLPDIWTHETAKPTAFYPVDTGYFLRRVTWSERETNHSPSSVAKIKKVWYFISTSHADRHGLVT
jgi:hypothetical protein